MVEISTLTSKSEKVDSIIFRLKSRLIATNKNLIKTETIYKLCTRTIDLTGKDDEQDELLEIGMKQTIQSRLYANRFFSVYKGYFVNVDDCTNIAYLSMVINEKDNVLTNKVGVRNDIKKRINELMAANGQMVMVPDKDGILNVEETKTQEEIIADLEADAV